MHYVRTLIYKYMSFIWLISNYNQMETQFLNCVITVGDFINMKTINITL